MALSDEDVRAIAEYARIALSGQELQEMRDYMNDAIQVLEPIREYELDGVVPTFHPIGKLTNVMSEDCVDQTERALSVEQALLNAGAKKDRSFRVPSILGEAGGDR